MYLEPLLNDYRKIRRQKRDGNFELSHMDELIDQLLHEERVCDVQLPRIQKRGVLEENIELEPRTSVLEGDLLEEQDGSSEEEPEQVVEDRRRVEREKERDRDRKRHRSRSRSRDRRGDRDGRDRKRDKDRRDDRDRRDDDRDRRENDRDRRDKRSGGGGGGKDDLSVDETNKLRAQLE